MWVCQVYDNASISCQSWHLGWKYLLIQSLTSFLIFNWCHSFHIEIIDSTTIRSSINNLIYHINITIQNIFNIWYPKFSIAENGYSGVHCCWPILVEFKLSRYWKVCFVKLVFALISHHEAVWFYNQKKFQIQKIKPSQTGVL